MNGRHERVGLRLALVSFVVLVAALGIATTVRGAAVSHVNGSIAFTQFVDTEQIWSMLVDGTRKTRLVSGPGLYFEAVASPDGTRLAYVSNVDGDSEIYVSTVAGKAPKQLTANDAVDFDPSWSPDGRRIAFSSDRDGNFEVYSMSASDGSGVKRLTLRPGSDENPVYSPNGKQIAFWSDKAGSEDIYVMRVGGGGLERLTTSRDDEQFPAWSPDGRTIVFTVYPLDGDDSDLWIMNADGSRRRPYVETYRDESWPAFSPDGARIAYTADDDVYVQRVDGKQRKVVAREGFGPSWTPKGRIVYTRTEFWNAEIGVVDNDGRNDRLATRYAGYDGWPSWSPDGLTIAFASERGSTGADLYTMSAAGGPVKQLLRLRGYQGDPSWSPDGRRLVYVTDVGDWTYRLFVIEVETQTYRRIETFAGEDDWDLDPSFGPDGRRVVFASDRESSWDLYTVDTVSGGVRRLTTSARNDEWAPDWSPDGQTIVFSSDASGSRNIWSLNLATGALRRLTTGTVEDDYPVWSPDGQLIAFQRELDDSTMSVYVMRADGSDLTRVTRMPDPAGFASWQSLALAE